MLQFTDKAFDMVETSEIYTLSLAQPVGAWGHASLALKARAGAAFDTNRGFKLSAEAEASLVASIEAEIGGALTATLKAALGVGIKGVFQAQTPLNLFDEAGLVARAELSINASAYAALQVTMAVEDLHRKLGESFPGIGSELCKIILEEFALSAGIWAKASLSAEIMANLIIAGSFKGSKPGFTFAAEAGAGLGLGCGIQFLVNLGVADPARMLRRIGDCLSATVLAAVGPSMESDKFARAAFEILVPCILEAAHTAGTMLNVDTLSMDAPAALSRSFVAQSLKSVVRAGAGVALAELEEVLKQLEGTFKSANARSAETGQAAFEAVWNSVGKLGAADSTRWIAALLDVVAQIDVVLGLPGIPADTAKTATSMAATLWACGALLDGIMVAPARGAAVKESILYGEVPLDPGKRIGAVFGAKVTYARLASHLSTHLDPLLENAPEVKGVLSVVRTVLGEEEGIIAKLMRHAGRRAENHSFTLDGSLAQLLGKILKDDVLPWLEDAAQHANAPQSLPLFVRIFLRPLLTATPAILDKALAGGSSKDERRRRGEALSAILMTVVGPVIVEAISAVVDAGATQGPGAAQSAAGVMVAHGESSPHYQQLAAATSRNVPSPGELAAVMGGVQKTVVVFAGSGMRPVFDLAGRLLDAGVGHPDSCDSATAIILGSDGAPNQDGLLDLVGGMFGKAIEVAGLMLLDFFDQLLVAIQQSAQAFADWIAATAQFVLDSLKNGLELIGQSLEAIAERLARALEALAQFAGRLAEAVAKLMELLRENLSAFMNHLRRTVGEWIRSVMPDWISGWLAPLVDRILDASTAATDLLSDMAVGAGKALARLLKDMAEQGLISEGAVLDAMRRSMRKGSNSDVHLDIKNVGIPITIDTGLLAGAALSTVEFHPDSRPLLADIVAEAASYRVHYSAKRQMEELQSTTKDQAETAGKVANLTTGEPLTAIISSPLSSDVPIVGDTPMNIRISGANDSFVNPGNSFGMPNRVVVVLNGQTIKYRPRDWRVVGNELFFTAWLTVVIPISGTAKKPASRTVSQTTMTLPARTAARRTNGQPASPFPEGGDVEVTVSVIKHAADLSESPDHLNPRDGLVRSGDRHPWADGLRGMDPTTPKIHFPARAGVNTLYVAATDGAGRTCEATAVFVLQPDLAQQPDVRIEKIHYEGGAATEHVVLRNTGTTTVDLSGWSLQDPAHHRIPLTKVFLPAQGLISVHTGKGSDDSGHVYGGRGAGIWNEAGDTVLLVNAHGELVHHVTYEN